ncbi:MAG TPA: gliding motility-associated C-terminal domain-containing protein [Saprospiraceae bacterium]|nr:gliding motility-associated C-terminal domain-containing protein [Saprospiraceae bacterium]
MRHLILAIVVISFSIEVLSQCTGIMADAGPDQFSCDPAMPPQLHGAANGSMFSWVPTTFLSDPTSLEPFVNAPPGRYKYKLVTSGVDNVNLISNGDFEQGNTGFSTNYNYNTDLTGEGTYYVGADPSSYHPGFSPCGDHTTGAGNQMIINGSVSAGSNVWCQTVGLSAGKMYLFKFQLQSVVGGNPPLIDIQFNGNSVGQISSSGVCNWVPFEYCFKATSGSLQICLREMTGVAGGNDFAFDDIELFEKCEVEDEVEVEIVNLRALIDIPNKPRCSSDIFDLDGSLSSSGAGIMYEWSTVDGRLISTNGNKAKAQGSGTYKLKVIYDNPPVKCEKEVEVYVDVAEDLEGLLEVNGLASCSKDTVTLYAQILNGSGRYNYTWTPRPNVLSGQGSPQIKVVLPGWYSVIIQDLQSGCIWEKMEFVNADTSQPVIEISGDTLLNCKFKTTSLIPSSFDTLKYQYVWIVDQSNPIFNESRIQLSKSGQVKLIVIDKVNQCRDTGEINVKLDTSNVMLELGQDIVLNCKTRSGSILPQVSSTNDSLNYQWRLPKNLIYNEGQLNPKLVQDSGVVYIRVENRNNFCFTEDSLYVRIDTTPIDIKLVADSVINCKDREAELSFNLSDPLLYDFQWRSMNLVDSTNGSIKVKNQGWYVLNVYNKANYCNDIDSVYVRVDTIKSIISLSAPNVFKCNDSLVSILCNANPNSASLKYNWSSVNGLFSPGSQSNEINARSAGTYYLVLENTMNFCIDSASFTIVPDSNAPRLFISPVSNINCRDTQVQLLGRILNPELSPYEVIWNGLNGEQFSQLDSMTVNTSIPGTYRLKVKNLTNGCSSFYDINVGIDTVAPKIDATVSDLIDCKVKEAILSVNKDSLKNLNIEWYNANKGLLGSSDQLKVNQAGVYWFKIINPKNHCEFWDSLHLVENSKNPLSKIKDPQELNCKVNQVELDGTLSSSGNPFVYQWSALSGNLLLATDLLINKVNQAGIYVFTVLDTTNDCVTFDTVIVKENKLKPIVVKNPYRQLTCSVMDVELSIVSNPNFLISWKPNSGILSSNLNSGLINVGQAGIYYISIIDTINGCEQLDSFVVIQNLNKPTAVNIQTESAKCSGETGYVRQVSVNGGTVPYQYWINGKKVTDFNSEFLFAGKYELTIIDSNGCELKQNFDITEPKPIDVKLPNSIQLVDKNSGQIFAIPSIAESSIASINWTPTDGLSCSDCLNPIVSNAKDGDVYTITIKDKNGCTAEASIVIYVQARLFNVPNIFSPNGDNLNDQFYPIVTEGSFKEIRKMAIYNRWGELVFLREHFAPNQPALGWDGTFKSRYLNPAVFVYLIEIEWGNGQVEQFTGDLTLIK